MGNFDLKKYLAEGRLLKENTGLITFEQLKQACSNSYKEYYLTFFYHHLPQEDNEIDKAEGLDDLVNILDGLGFNGNEAYDFIFDSILK